jgi:hypothetical protein
VPPREWELSWSYAVEVSDASPHGDHQVGKASVFWVLLALAIVEILARAEKPEAVTPAAAPAAA